MAITRTSTLADVSFKGFYDTSAALNAAWPVGVDQDFAIVGDTDTVWLWDGDTTAWVDSGIQSGVVSFNGRTGAVVPAANDYTWAEVDKTTSSIADITTKNHTDLTAGSGSDHADVATNTTHRGLTNNPHSVTATQVGLGSAANVDTTPEMLPSVFINGGGFAITAGIKGWYEVPFDCTITRVDLLADQSGSIVIDIWNDTYANYPPTDADSITASAPPTITTAIKSTDSTLTGWSTNLTRGTVLYFNVDSATTIEKCGMNIWVTRT